tara:strand:- start:729 stop:974 length:246 start_codon:yes stop_codon:yes gene_type:complete
MNNKEKIAFLKGEEKRLTEKAKQYAREGFTDSARATMRLATGVKNDRASAMLARLNEKELFRAAVKAGKLEFVVVGRKAQS